MIFEAILRVTFELGFRDGFGDLPSPFDPPERDWVINEIGMGSGVAKGFVEVDSRIETQSWASKATNKKLLKKFDVEIVSKDGKNKVEIRMISFQTQHRYGKNLWLVSF